ncbi:sensor histidine kinase [Salimicrobium halophilum]|uniref:Sensor histidine kinase n=1 Tax=Salimicrobium halophilum TaxID=86666 RepID=A0A1G8SV07_9BACI|nr:sensor histidine kinase [Salimicrobium halophilum]SDJ33014.1 two-component system, NarL family, sensor histidine kinase LiaS [Salimicrobium halophilum]
MKKTILLHTLLFLMFSIFLMGLTLFIFPPEKWSLLYTEEVLDIPFVLVPVIVALILGIGTGIAQGLQEKQRQKALYQHLDSLVQGVPIGSGTKEDLGEDLTGRLSAIGEKMERQTELSRKQASERAEEREKSLQEVVAQERSRLARELHDSVSQQLFAASMMMSAINEQQEENRQLKMVEKMIHQSQLEMRALLLHLRPVPLKGKTLREGTEELLEELTQKVPLHVEKKLEDVGLEKGIEDQLFRILQESVSNTLRHAEAEKLSVQLLHRDGFILLRIEDDGKGFDAEGTASNSYGLDNMKERAFEIGGVLKVVSVKGNGTRIEVKVPYTKGGEVDDSSTVRG